MVQTSRLVPVCNRSDLRVERGNVTVIYGTTRPIWISVRVTSCTLKLACSLSRTAAECRVGSVVAKHHIPNLPTRLESLTQRDLILKTDIYLSERNWTEQDWNTDTDKHNRTVRSCRVLIFSHLLYWYPSYLSCCWCCQHLFSKRSAFFVLKTSQLFRQVLVLFFFFQIYSTYFLSPMNHVMHQHPPRSHVRMSIIIQLIYQDIVCIETRRTYSSDFTSLLHRHEHLSCFFPRMQFDSET